MANDDTPKTGDSTGDLGLESGGEPAQKPLTPVEFRTRRDMSLVTEALEHRMDSLDKLAKKNDDEGYPSLGRKVKADAMQIREIVLPAFREQRELPIANPGDILSGVTSLIGPAFAKIPMTEKTDADSRDREIIETIAPRIARAIAIAAERGFWAGEASRESQPDLIGLRAITDARLEP